MKSKLFGFLTAGLLLLTPTVPTLRAQVVADGATNTLSNVTNAFIGDVTVGTNGSFTLLVLSDNALLTNSVNGVIGLNLTASSNEVQLLSPTARWRMGGSLFVGSNGAMNRLVLSNGAFVDNNNGTLGNRVDSSNNFALVTGAGSLWSNRLDLRVGTGGRSNQLIVRDGGWVASQSGFVGNNVGANNNFALVSGSGSVWSNALNLTVGFNGVGNRLVIEAGGLAHCNLGKVGDFGSATDNEARVTGTGSRWNVQTDLTIGRLLGGNRLIVSNGAVVWSGNGLIGNISTAPNNQVLVTSAGSVWSNRNDLTVGDFASGNVLQVDNGATALTSNLFIGFNSLSANNRVTVDGGTLCVTNAVGTGVLDVRRGTNVLNVGLIEVDRLLVTNTAGKFEFNGGTLSARNAKISNGQLFRAGNGVSPATFLLAGNGSHSFPNGLTVSANAVLTGNGGFDSASLVTVSSGGTLAPGASIGRIILSNTPSLQGNVSMEISNNGPGLTNDQIEVAGVLALLTINYGGSLTVTNIGANALAVGDRFKLFNAATYSGSFATFSLPPLAFGLRWLNNLLVDGSVEVVIATPPTVQTLPASSITSIAATLNGVANPNGLDSVAWFEWGTNGNYANASPPRAVGSGVAETNVSEMITGLTGGVGYFFRAVASNSMGKVHGRSRGFAVGFALGPFCFDFNNGQLPANAALHGHAFISITNGVGNSGVLKLTRALPSQKGSLIMEPLNPGATVTAMEARFDVRIGNDEFTTHADGMSFVWSTGLPDVAFGEEYGGVLTGLPPLPGLAVSFDTINFFNEPGDLAPGVDVIWGGIVARFDLASYDPPFASDFLITDEYFVSVVITVSADGYLNVVYRNRPLVSNYHLSNFAGLTNARFAWGARTGGFWDNHFVDNLCLTTFTDCPVPQILITRSGVNAAITFTGNLQSAPTVSGPWTDFQGAVSPHIIPTTGQSFFRAISTCGNAP